jgi:hypothetical protein
MVRDSVQDGSREYAHFSAPGTAIYIFFVLNNDFVDTTFSIDTVVDKQVTIVPGFLVGQPMQPAQYNFTIFQSTSLKPCRHFLNMSGEVYLDYAIVTQVVFN